MSFLAYPLASAVAFSGLFVGAFLARSAKEEMPTASRYFPWVQKFILVAIAAFLLNYFSLGIAARVVCYAVVILLLLRYGKINFYPLLGIAFFLLGQSGQGLFAVSLLVFMYGFPAGSMFIIRNKRISAYASAQGIISRYGLFIVVAVGLQVTFSLLR
jgi:hypothetical protein